MVSALILFFGFCHRVFIYLFYPLILYWLGFGVGNLFVFTLYVVITVSKKYLNIGLMLNFIKKNIWFYCLKNIKNKETGIEKEKEKMGAFF